MRRTNSSVTYARSKSESVVCKRLLNMNKNPNQQVKRYTDIENQKCAKSCLRVCIIFGSVILGAAAISLGIYYGKQKPQAPTNQTVSDQPFQSYLLQNKFLPAWSHTSSSQLKDQPAYLQLFTNQSNINLLNAFIKRHNYSEVFVYGGCVEHNLESFKSGVFPRQQELVQFIQQLNANTSIITYLNDLQANFQNINQLYSVMQPFISLRAFHNLRRIVFQVLTGSELNLFRLLDQVYQIQKLNQNVWFVVTYPMIKADLTQARQILSTLEVNHILGSETTFGQMLAAVTQQIIYLNQVDDLDQVAFEYAEVKKLFARVDFMHQVDLGGLEMLEQLESVVANLQIDNFGVKSYLEIYDKLYYQEPVDSEEAWLVDLYQQQK
uniref:Uncharacterized protein n=1 Tax=Trepomonas sp. PC1 TaxID=1076344 RepID=A0A146K266_9EUKA|eukprot:JAP90807.1 hypothetical protein TPC1_17785 [Trepomonas sp. PC1]